MLPYGTDNAGFVVGNGPDIDLGADDFLLLIVAGISHSTEAKTFFRKSDSLAFPKQAALEWLFYNPDGFRLTGEINETTVVSNVATDAGPMRLYGLRRVSERAEIRVNGQIVGSLPLATPGASTQNDSDLFIGIVGYFVPTPVDTLHAAIVVRGALDSADVGRLEAYLMQAFGL